MEKYEFNDCYEIGVRESAEEYDRSSGKDEITYEIVDHLGVLRTFPNGWNRELNIVAWNGRKANFDLRDWTPDHNRMTKGITLTREEMRKLCKMFREEDTSDEKPEKKKED